MTTTSQASTSFGAPAGPDPLDRPGAARSAAAESLIARLDDPRTAAALHDLLDQAEMLAMAATMADGLLRRSETLASNLAEGLGEARAAVVGASGGEESVIQELGALLTLLRAAVPALQALLSSSLVQPATIAGLEMLTASLTEGLAHARTVPVRQTGVRSLLSELREPATLRGLGALLGVARALGRRAGA